MGADYMIGAFATNVAYFIWEKHPKTIQNPQKKEKKRKTNQTNKQITDTTTDSLRIQRRWTLMLNDLQINASNVSLLILWNVSYSLFADFDFSFPTLCGI